MCGHFLYYCEITYSFYSDNQRHKIEKDGEIWYNNKIENKYRPF